MKTNQTQWSKADLKTYILLLCAHADQMESEEELAFIKSKTELESFQKIYEEFCQDDEECCFEKIEDAIGHHAYSEREISALKKEIREVFISDRKLLMPEQNLERILDNILY